MPIMHTLVGEKMYNSLLNSFDPQFEYYCYKNCLLKLLYLYDVKHPELYIDCTTQWLFEYSINKGSDFTFSTGEIYSGLIEPYINSISVFDFKSHTKDTIDKKCKDFLDCGLPYIAATDVFYLPYTNYFKKFHSYHTLIVLNQNSKDEYLISDPYPPWFYYGIIEADNLENSRLSANEGNGILNNIPINYMCAFLENKNFNTDPYSLIHLQLKKSLDWFYSKSDISIIKGYFAILEFFNKFTIILGDTPQYDITSLIENFYHKSYFVANRKKLFLWWIKKSEEIIGNKIFENFIMLQNQTIKNWNSFSSLLIKFSINNKVDNDIYSLMKKIVEDEKKCYYSLYKIYNILI